MGERIYIFGAHSRAQTLAVYLTFLQPDLRIKAFLYDNDEPNPSGIGNVPVIYLNEKRKLCTDYPVYIGTRSIFHGQIRKKLEKTGFKRIYPITYEVDLKLRNEFLEQYCSGMGREFLKIEKLPGVSQKGNLVCFSSRAAKIYVVRTIYDKPLSQSWKLPFWEQEIQAGASLTKERLSEDILTDNIGDNISDKNGQFCELTALYWVWKHAEEDIVGLAHYRRHFILPDDWMERMACNEIDVILPVPLYVAPSLEENYKKRHEEINWNDMMQCLKKRDIHSYHKACGFFKTNLYSPCNMFIMRKEVLDELCTWLFPVLFHVARQGGQKEDKYQNRYPGFLSERLITLFFENNKRKYKIVYADKNFIA